MVVEYLVGVLGRDLAEVSSWWGRTIVVVVVGVVATQAAYFVWPRFH